MPGAGFGRQRFLAGLTASTVLTACGGSGSSSTPAPAANPPAAPGPTPTPLAKSAAPGAALNVPLTVDASLTDLPAGTPVYLYVVGLVSTGGGNTFYRLDSSGMPHVMTTADNKIPQFTFPGEASLPRETADFIGHGNYPLAWADYSIPVEVGARTEISLGDINPTNCPGLGTGTAAFSGRVYISVGVPKVPFTVQSNGYTAPVTIGGPGQYCLFDWIEFSYDSQGSFNGNTTQVDQFGFELTLNGTPGGKLQGKLNAPRLTIMNEFGTLTGPFGGGTLQVPMPANAAPAFPANVNFLRVLSPKDLTGNPNYNGPLKSYFNASIAQWYTTWQQTPLVTKDLSTGYYTGIVPTSGANAGTLVFYKGQYPTLADLTSANPPVAFLLTGTNPATNVILTSDIWQCENTLASGGDAQKNVGKMIAAAFNRGVVSNSMDDSTCDTPSVVAGFYPAGATFNEWSKLFHGYSVNTLSYAFPYDDVCNQNPSIGITGTSSITIGLGKFFS